MQKNFRDADKRGVSEEQKLHSTDEQLAAIQEEMTSCETAMSELEYRLPEEKSMEAELADRFKGQGELTNEMALAFIDAVYLYPDRRVEIKWKFEDMFL